MGRGIDDIRPVAIEALSKIGPEAVAAVVAQLLNKNETWQAREQAAEALGKMGPVANDAIPALVAAIHDSSPVSFDAIKALGKIGRDAAPALVAVFRHASDKRIRAYTKFKLKEIGLDAIAALKAGVRDENGTIHKGIAKILMKIDPDSAIEFLHQEESGAASLKGLELMGDRPVLLKQALRQFQRIVEICKERKTNRFSIRDMASQLGDVEGGTLGNRLEQVSQLFQDYFRDIEGKTVTDDWDEQAGFEHKILDRGEKRKPMICEPLGLRAWELTCEWLKGEEEREKARNQAKRQRN